MLYSPPPCTYFTEPTVIRHDQALLKLWGDETSGQVADWFYLSSEEIHALVFALPPGGRYQRSEGYRTVYAGDICYYVLQGTLTLHNPRIKKQPFSSPSLLVTCRQISQQFEPCHLSRERRYRHNAREVRR
jgi:hypothetical protein